jgi:hypothetical protein
MFTEDMILGALMNMLISMIVYCLLSIKSNA